MKFILFIIKEIVREGQLLSANMKRSQAIFSNYLLFPVKLDFIQMLQKGAIAGKMMGPQ